jgi:NADPH:quinone reductase-like Zn-dependent oxidoreductase
MSFETDIVIAQEASPITRNSSSATTSAVARSGITTMKAIYLKEQGGSGALVTGEIPRPEPQADEVLVKVCATTVMPSELQWFTSFHLPFGEPRAFPIVLGHEFSGVVESLGARVNGFMVGEEVYGLIDWFVNGAQAEYCLAKATALARKPQSIGHVQAAAVPISALTAWQGLFERANLRRGERILIHGAAGGVGSFAVQLARRCGAHIIATVSSGDFKFVRSLGADELIDYRTTRFEIVVKEVDVVFDAVGGEILERSWPLVANGGRVVTVATQSNGASAPRVRDAFMRVQPDSSQLAEIGRMIDAGELRSFVGTIFPLAATRLAFARATYGFRRGKVVVRVAESYTTSR